MYSASSLLSVGSALLLLFIWLYPLFLVNRSAKTTGFIKIFWLFLTLLMSWVGYGMYLVTFLEKSDD